jgi:hypothetical protein
MLRTKIKTEIRLSPNGKTYDVWYSVDGGQSFELHKRGFTSQRDALKETTSINGHFRLLRDLQK